MIPANPPFILASGSPRRKDLLEEAGYQFTVVSPEVEEIHDLRRDIRELTTLNASLKGKAVSGKNPDSVVVAADTLVLLDDEVLGKPVDRAEAEEMLGRLNGTTHQVFTAVCLICESIGKTVTIGVTTDVTFKLLSLEEMRTYHALINPMDKAGAYAAQENGEHIIDSIEGSMTNVIGLPMDEVAHTLGAEFGILPKR